MKKYVFSIAIMLLFIEFCSLAQPSRDVSITVSNNDAYIRTDGSANTGGTEFRVGGSDGGKDACAVMPCQLPVLNPGEVITDAVFKIKFLNLPSWFNDGWHIDVYAIPYRSTNVIDNVADYYQGDFGGDPDATAIQDDIVSKNSSGGWIATSSDANEILVDFIKEQYDDGAVGGDWIFIRFSPDIANATDYHMYKFNSANSSDKPVLELTITDLSVSGVSIDQTGPITLEPGATTNLTATLIPPNAINQSISWSTSNGSIASVSSGGVVTAGSTEGNATITVTTDDGSFTDDIEINVECPNIIPSNFSAIKGYTEVTLTWDAVEGAESYKIYYGTNAGGPYTVETIDDGTATSTIITGLTNGIPYYFKISAISNQGICESDLSSDVSATPSDIYEYENAGIYISTLESGKNLAQGMSAMRIDGQPNNKKGFGIYIPLDFVIDISAPNAEDNLDACLTFYFDLASLPDGMNLASLALYRFNEPNQAWERMGGEVNLDGENSYVKLCGIDEFSHWTLAGSVPESVPLKNWGLVLIFLAIAGVIAIRKF